MGDDRRRTVDARAQSRTRRRRAAGASRRHAATHIALSAALKRERRMRRRLERAAVEQGVRGASCDADEAGRLQREEEFDDELDAAIERGDFVLYLQPKVRPSDGSLAGAEALVRWAHPERGMISPAAFIPALERSGGILDLDLHMFEQACALEARWMREKGAALPLSVNLSRLHVHDDAFIERFARIAHRYGVAPGIIEMELTESVFLDDEGIERVARAVREMHRHGFRCSLDDFGAGFSSLGLLARFDVDAVKLDRAFFLDETQRTRDVVETIVQLAHKLGVSAVAEGVETPEQVAFLRSIGCDAVQGFVHAAPLSVDEFEAWACERYAEIPVCAR